MIFRNSIHSIFRSKGKSTLFTLLIFSTTLALALSVSVWASVAQFLEDCDDFYTTIGIIDYMGTEYPDDTIYDPAMADALASLDTAKISDDDATLLWETPSRTFGFIQGFWRSDSYMPDKMLSVLVVGNVSYSEDNNIYTAVVFESLYSSSVEENKIIYIDENFGTFEPGRYYLVFGEIYRGYSPLFHLGRATFDNAIASANGLTIPHMIDITANEGDGGFFEIPEDTVLKPVADTLAVTNNSVLISGTNDLSALPAFHQEELYITEGRGFTPEEYTNGSHVIVIPDLMAARLGIGIGDMVDLSASVSDQPGIYNSYWAPEGFSYQSNFKVIGITNTVLDKSWYVFVPRAAGLPVSQFPIGYTVGHAIIRNDEASDFFLRLEPIAINRFQLRIFDQGYASVAIPYQTILTTAKIVTMVCLLVELAVIMLFGFLFVYRQLETSRTMIMLGTGKPRVFGYFLISSGLISSVAASAGAASGYWLHDQIIVLVSKAAEKVSLIDSRFSNGNLTISRTLEFAPELEWWLFLIIGVIVFTLALLACSFFIIRTFHHNKPKIRKFRGPKKESRSSRLAGGSLKYAILSILRGGARSLVVPVLAVAVVLFFGILSSTAKQYQDQLETIYDNTTVKGYFTDIKGKQIGKLVVNAYNVAHLSDGGFLKKLSISISEPYLFTGITQLADGTLMDITPLYVPFNNYVRESLEGVILRGPDLTATNDMRTSPEFYYADTITTTFIEGYDESVLAVPFGDEDILSCIIPTSLMSEQNIALGDTIRVANDDIILNRADNERIYRYYDLHVVGNYEKQGTEDTIFAPLSLFFDTGLIWDAGQHTQGGLAKTIEQADQWPPEKVEQLQSEVLHSVSFTLKESRDLITFKDTLTHYGFSQVQNVDKVREFIILRDAAFNNAVASVKQQIHHINILYPFLYALVGIIAITVSYLLVTSRKSEFATMRGLGATRMHAFFSFYFEQNILCWVGIGTGLVIWRAIWGQLTNPHLILTGGFIICYFLGCIASIMIMNHSRVLIILLDRD